MKVFLTGGTGNIGQYVIKALLQAGHYLKLYTRTPDRIAQIAQLKGVELVQGNILQLDSMNAALQGCDAVIHIALGWGNSPLEMLDHDTRVTAFLLQAAEQAGVKNFMYTSSTAAIGHIRDGMDETAACKPTDLYGATKAASESFVLGFRQYYTGQGKYGISVNMRRNIIRPGYVFSNPAFDGGASQSDVRFRDIARAILRNEDLVFSENEGTQFLCAEQIAQVYLKLVESDRNEEIILALSAKHTAWADIARMAKELHPASISNILVNKDQGNLSAATYDVSKMHRLFGLRFDATNYLREHMQWNLEREKLVLAGKQVHDVYHVW